MIDYSLFGTYNRNAIGIILDNIRDRFAISKNEKGWENATVYNNGNGIKIYAQINKYQECPKLFVAFSPHKQYNDNLHNANYFTFVKARNQIIKTFESIGITKELFQEFYISSLEIGINFSVQSDVYTLLNSALSKGSQFFETHNKYKHYRFAENKSDKYLKTKFYIKSEQKDNDQDKTYFELDYCPSNIMRFETKLQRAEKFDYIDFGNMESLFCENAEERITNQLLKEFDKLFFFSIKDINTKKLTNPQQKKYYQYQVKGYWESLNTRNRNEQRKYYSEKMPKKTDIKQELRETILEHLQLKKYVGIPNEIMVKSTSKFLSNFLHIYISENSIDIELNNRFCNLCNYIGIGKTTNLIQKRNENKRVCKITGLDISTQNIRSKFLREKTLKNLKENNHEIYKFLEKKYLTNKAKKLTEKEQLYRICKVIRDTDSNPRNNRARFEERNYPQNQLQFNF
ncbi:hypothetical protein [Epilithonimonas hispanica]|uniref:Uncharacterized protein n=1 Tax=Epilithonimonas hispanica TaxID=358687 RepID=A0A3D9CWS8_9FLAO|nr:hypothetical protein [Epilithonimonas hispanica]REC70226.1 hypothetical protein DRF58_10470 [Epilithonimonas hispanica]